jgi:outer membrane receptor protein involved in Fe transport
MRRLITFLPIKAVNFLPDLRLESGASAMLRRIAGLTALFLLASAAFAQQESGQIAGTVTDQSGAVVPNANVTVTNSGTSASRSAVTSGAGTYLVTGLQPATYQVVVKAGSFKQYSATIEVTVGARATLDAKLSIDNAVTQVEVIAEGGAQVNTQSQELSQVVNAQQVSTLPSLTRNPYDFVAISGNISNGDSSSSGSATGQTNTNTQNATTRGVGFNINGQRSTGTEILLDGVENVSVFSDGIGIFVPLDSMQEFRVATSDFEPQFGRASGGVVNVTTKGGTNAFHGDAWEYNRLSAYTSNTYTNSVLGVPKGTYTRNQFGFTVGGPIFKSKLFFFGSTEWTRVRSAAQLTAGVPTPQFLALAAPNIQSFFSTYGGKHTFNYTQTYSAADVYDTIPAGLPPTTPVFGAVSFTAPQNAGGSVPQNTYNIVGRFDYSMTDKTQIFFRYVDYNEIDQPGAIFASPYSQYNVGQTSDDQAYLLSLSHIFTPAFTSNTKLSFSRFNTFQAYDTSLQNVPVLIVSVLATIPHTGTPIQLPGFFDTNPANGGLPYGGPQNTSQINQDLNFQKGQHSVQVGAQLVYIQDNQAYGAYAQATQQLGNGRTPGLQALYDGSLFQFQAAVDPKGALPCVKNQYTGALTPTSGCSIHLPASSPSFARSNRFKDWAVYAQDSWKFTPRFTGNYGVRYEYYGVQHNNNPNLDSNFYYGPGSTVPQMMHTGQVSTVPNSPIGRLWNPTYGAISPRVGFAYDIFGNGRDSIRGGYGIAYERNFGNVTFNVIQNPPNYAVIVVNNTRVTNSNAGPLAGNSAPPSSPCYPAACLPPTSLRHVDQNIRTAQTQFWSFAVEHGLTNSAMLSVQYVGARGVHLYDIKNYNGVGGGNALLGDPNVDPVSRNYGLTRVNNQYSNVNNRGSGGSSNYQGLNVQFQATNMHQTGLGLVSNYTWSHSLDDLSTTFSETNNAFGLGYTNPFNPALDYGNGDLDVRHRWVVAPVYIEPYFKNRHNLMGEVLGGWQISGIYQVHTGAPFSFFDLTNNFSSYNVARYTTNQGITQHTFKSIPSGASGGSTNAFVIGQLPPAVSWGNTKLFPPSSADPTKPDLKDYPDGISDWGPWPSNMAARNAFRGPGLWTFDVAVAKTFPIHESINMEFRAEGFNILNHHNLFLQESLNDVSNTKPNASGNVIPPIIGSKGGIGNNGGANDERRFGQFALKINF